MKFLKWQLKFESSIGLSSTHFILQNKSTLGCSQDSHFLSRPEEKNKIQMPPFEKISQKSLTLALNTE